MTYRTVELPPYSDLERVNVEFDWTFTSFERGWGYSTLV